MVVGAAEWCCFDRGVAEAAENVVGVALTSLLDRGRESARGGKSRKEIRSQEQHTFRDVERHGEGWENFTDEAFGEESEGSD